MKKLLSVLVSLVLVFTLVSCSIGDVQKDIKDKHNKNVAIDKYKITLVDGKQIDVLGPFHVVDKDGRIVLDIYDIVKVHYDEDGANANMIFAFKDETKEKFSNATKTISEYTNGENYMSVYLKGSLLGVISVTSQMDLEELRFLVGASDELKKEIDILNDIIRDIR